MSKSLNHKSCLLCCLSLLLLTQGCSSRSSPGIRQIHTTVDSAEPDSSNIKPNASTSFEWRQRPTGQIAPGFEFELSSAADEKLNGKYRVSFTGQLELPYGVVIQAAGLSEAQLKKEIGKAYTEYFRSEPNVLVTLASRMYWVEVRGLVSKPGQYLVRLDSSIDEVIGAAGGLLDSSSGKGTESVVRYARIIQGERSVVVNMADYYAGLQQLSPRWQGGETLFIQSSGQQALGSRAEGPAIVQVLGQVRNPGEYQFSANSDVIDYVVRAGGPTDRAALDRIEIVRRSGVDKQAILLSLIDNDERVELPALKAEDVLVVHADNPTQAERDLRTTSEVASIITGFVTVVILGLSL